MGGFRDRVCYEHDSGAILDGDTRYVMFRADVIAACFSALPRDIRMTALTALGNAVTANGGRSLERYLAMVDGNTDTLIDTVRTTAADLGWGRWHFVHDRQTFALEVHESPFALISPADDTPVCAPITGMLRALGAIVLGGAVDAIECECRALGAPMCRFQVKRIDRT